MSHIMMLRLTLAFTALGLSLIAVVLPLFGYPYSSFAVLLLVSLGAAMSGGGAAISLIRQGRAWAWIVLVIVIAAPLLIIVMHLRG